MIPFYKCMLQYVKYTICSCLLVVIFKMRCYMIGVHLKFSANRQCPKNPYLRGEGGGKARNYIKKYLRRLDYFNKMCQGMFNNSKAFKS